MATNSIPNFEQLKPRVEALGLELVTCNDGVQLVLNRNGWTIEFVRQTDADDLEDWLDDSERPDVRSECIRLQAARVVGAYHELRDGMGTWDYETAADFPIGLFGELVTQIQALAEWLEPATPVSKVVNRIAAIRDLTKEEVQAGLHDEAAREIAAKYPNAGEHERKLRVAIRESMCETDEEEDEVYQTIRKALES